MRQILFVFTSVCKYYDFSEPNAVKIHAVYECQPEMRLDHLIYQQRWVEAEEFAETFGLNTEVCDSYSILHLTS